MCCSPRQEHPVCLTRTQSGRALTAPGGTAHVRFSPLPVQATPPPGTERSGRARGAVTVNRIAWCTPSQTSSSAGRSPPQHRTRFRYLKTLRPSPGGMWLRHWTSRSPSTASRGTAKMTRGHGIVRRVNRSVITERLIQFLHFIAKGTEHRETV